MHKRRQASDDDEELRQQRTEAAPHFQEVARVVECERGSDERWRIGLWVQARFFTPDERLAHAWLWAVGVIINLYNLLEGPPSPSILDGTSPSNDLVICTIFGRSAATAFAWALLATPAFARAFTPWTITQFLKNRKAR